MHVSRRLALAVAASCTCSLILRYREKAACDTKKCNIIVLGAYFEAQIQSQWAHPPSSGALLPDELLGHSEGRANAALVRSAKIIKSRFILMDCDAAAKADELSPCQLVSELGTNRKQV